MPVSASRNSCSQARTLTSHAISKLGSATWSLRPSKASRPRTAKRSSLPTMEDSPRRKSRGTWRSRWEPSRVAPARRWSACARCSSRSSTNRSNRQDKTVVDDHPIDDLAAYALGSLGGTERGRVETHILACASCAADLRAYREVVGVLPLDLAPVPPPSDAWNAIREAAAKQRARGQQSRKAIVLPAWLRVARWPAMAAALVALLIWNVTLQREL